MSKLGPKEIGRTTRTRTIARRRLIDRFDPNEISIPSDKALSSQSFLTSYSYSSSSSYSDFLEAGLRGHPRRTLRRSGRSSHARIREGIRPDPVRLHDGPAT